MKLITFILSVFILLNSFNIHFSDIAQLGDLFEHAQYHKQQYGDNFFTFLAKHYGQQNPDHQHQNKQQQTEHEKLPFQHCSQVITHLNFVVSNFEISFLKHQYSEKKSSFFSYKDFYTSSHTTKVLQPPRNA